MGLFSGLTGIADAVGLVSDVVGIGTSIIGGEKKADALENQAANIAQLTTKQQQFAKEQGEIEAGLIEQQGADEAEVLAYNQRVALENAEWQRLSGEIATQQAEKQWKAKVSNIAATFASSGARLTGTTNDVIAEQIAEAELDIYMTGLSAQRATAAEEDKAGIYALQKDQVETRAKTQAAGRRRVAELESEIAGISGSSSAAAARAQASTTRIGTFGNVFSGTANLLGDLAEVYN